MNPTNKHVTSSAQTANQPEPASLSPKTKIKLTNSPLVRRVLIGAGIVIVVGALAWASFGTISLKFASYQSGIDASTPYYLPSGYELKLPIKAETGKITLNYHAAKKHGFIITQEKSLWDSQAVKNMVDSSSNGRFLTTSDRGLTIFTYQGKAAWVNRGILYRISSGDQLASHELIKIANSL